MITYRSSTLQKSTRQLKTHLAYYTTILLHQTFWFFGFPYFVHPDNENCEEDQESAEDLREVGEIVEEDDLEENRDHDAARAVHQGHHVSFFIPQGEYLAGLGSQPAWYTVKCDKSIWTEVGLFNKQYTT